MSAQARAQEVRAEEAPMGSNAYIHGHFGSNPGRPAIPHATSAQTPGHMGSIPAERVSRSLDKGEAQLVCNVGLSHQQPGHLAQVPAERVSASLDEEEARLEREIAALEQQRA